MDNLQDEKGKDIYGLIQESYAPIGLHVDAGFDLNNQIYKQSFNSTDSCWKYRNF